MAKTAKKSAVAYSLIEYTAKGVSLSDTGDDNTEQSTIAHTVETVATQQKYRKKAIKKKIQFHNLKPFQPLFPVPLAQVILLVLPLLF